MPHGQALDELGGEDPLWVDRGPDRTTATPHTDASRLGVSVVLHRLIGMEWWKRFKESSHTDELRDRVKTFLESLKTNMWNFHICFPSCWFGLIGGMRGARGLYLDLLLHAD